LLRPSGGSLTGKLQVDTANWKAKTADWNVKTGNGHLELETGKQV
jgi:hypothetical protein